MMTGCRCCLLCCAAAVSEAVRNCLTADILR